MKRVLSAALVIGLSLIPVTGLADPSASGTKQEGNVITKVAAGAGFGVGGALDLSGKAPDKLNIADPNVGHRALGGSIGGGVGYSIVDRNTRTGRVSYAATLGTGGLAGLNMGFEAGGGALVGPKTGCRVFLGGALSGGANLYYGFQSKQFNGTGANNYVSDPKTVKYRDESVGGAALAGARLNPMAKAGMLCDMDNSQNFVALSGVASFPMQTGEKLNVSTGGNVLMTAGPTMASVTVTTPVGLNDQGEKVRVEAMAAATIGDVYLGASTAISTRIDKPIDTKHGDNIRTAAQAQVVVGAAF